MVCLNYHSLVYKFGYLHNKGHPVEEAEREVIMQVWLDGKAAWEQAYQQERETILELKAQRKEEEAKKKENIDNLKQKTQIEDQKLNNVLDPNDKYGYIQIVFMLICYN
jgi:ABC-type Zn2+ transport system substrate-binding protein/surface adhesin